MGHRYVAGSTRPANGRNRANEHLIAGNSSADGGDGPHCRANLQYPGHQGTDDAYNGGGQMTWISAKGNTTYTFDIWVMGDKDASKKTFTYTTGSD